MNTNNLTGLELLALIPDRAKDSDADLAAIKLKAFSRTLEEIEAEAEADEPLILFPD